MRGRRKISHATQQRDQQRKRRKPEPEQHETKQPLTDDELLDGLRTDIVFKFHGKQRAAS